VLRTSSRTTQAQGESGESAVLSRGKEVSRIQLHRRTGTEAGASPPRPSLALRRGFGNRHVEPVDQFEADGHRDRDLPAGWLGYYDDCQTPSVLRTLESWLRRRLRSVVWKQWNGDGRGFATSQTECEQGSGGRKPPALLTVRGASPLARLGHCFAECLLCQARASTHGRAVLA